LWTNIYGPAAGFSANTSYPPYLVHYYVGVTLGLLSIVLLLVAVSHRRTAYALLSVVLLLSVLAAALLGQAFVGSTPNDPADSVAMGCAFLVAFASILCFGFLVFGAELAPRMGMSPPTPE
jgi:heme A synthase